MAPGGRPGDDHRKSLRARPAPAPRPCRCRCRPPGDESDLAVRCHARSLLRVSDPPSGDRPRYQGFTSREKRGLASRPGRGGSGRAAAPGGGGFPAARVTVTLVALAGTALSIVIVPPCSSTIALLNGRPRACPLVAPRQPAVDLSERRRARSGSRRSTCRCRYPLTRMTEAPSVAAALTVIVPPESVNLGGVRQQVEGRPAAISPDHPCHLDGIGRPARRNKVSLARRALIAHHRHRGFDDLAEIDGRVRQGELAGPRSCSDPRTLLMMSSKCPAALPDVVPHIAHSSG